MLSYLKKHYICYFRDRFKMLSSPLGASAPLSPSAQATINKHLPKLTSKRLITAQSRVTTTNIHTAEVGCLTGKVKVQINEEL